MKMGCRKALPSPKSNNDALAEAALKAVADWRFSPLVKDGEAVSSKVRLPVVAALPNLARGRFALN